MHIFVIVLTLTFTISYAIQNTCTFISSLSWSGTHKFKCTEYDNNAAYSILQVGQKQTYLQQTAYFYDGSSRTIIIEHNPYSHTTTEEEYYTDPYGIETVIKTKYETINLIPKYYAKIKQLYLFNPM